MRRGRRPRPLRPARPASPLRAPLARFLGLAWPASEARGSADAHERGRRVADEVAVFQRRGGGRRHPPNAAPSTAPAARAFAPAQHLGCGGARRRARGRAHREQRRRRGARCLRAARMSRKPPCCGSGWGRAHASRARRRRLRPAKHAVRSSWPKPGACPSACPPGLELCGHCSLPQLLRRFRFLFLFLFLCAAGALRVHSVAARSLTPVLGGVSGETMAGSWTVLLPNSTLPPYFQSADTAVLCSPSAS